jgi:restriction endonuclease S subunit
MSGLPSGWIMSTVGQAGEVSLGRQRAPKYHHGDGMRPYLRVANVFEDRIDTTDVMQMTFSDDEFERYRLQPGDVLLNEGQSPHLLGRPAIYRGQPPDVAFTNSLIRFRAGPGVTPEWALVVFRHYMRSRRFMHESRITTNIAHLSATRFSAIEFPVPPFTEQRRIVAAIEEQLSRLDAGVAVLARARRNLKRMRDALFQLTVPQGSESWKAVTIEDTVRVVDYRGRTPPFSSAGIPHLRSFNVKDGRVKWDGCTWVTEDIFEKYMSRGLPSPGDLLFTTEAPMGEVAPAPEKKFCMAQRMMLLKPDPAIWQPEYLMYHLRSPWFQVHLRLNATGTTVQGISSRNFRPLSLYAPPLGIQEKLAPRIRENLGAIQDLERALQAADARGRQLRSAILASAFSGELIGQNPTDDSASVLLQRITAERASSNGNSPMRTRTPECCEKRPRHE